MHYPFAHASHDFVFALLKGAILTEFIKLIIIRKLFLNHKDSMLRGFTSFLPRQTVTKIASAVCHLWPKWKIYRRNTFAYLKFDYISDHPVHNGFIQFAYLTYILNKITIINLFYIWKMTAYVDCRFRENEFDFCQFARTTAE